MLKLQCVELDPGLLELSLGGLVQHVLVLLQGGQNHMQGYGHLSHVKSPVCTVKNNKLMLKIFKNKLGDAIAISNLKLSITDSLTGVGVF